jgi:hypothetical protein
MGEVAIGSLAAPANYIRLLFAMSRTIFRFSFACAAVQPPAWNAAVAPFNTVYPATDTLEYAKGVPLWTK